MLQRPVHIRLTGRARQRSAARRDLQLLPFARWAGSTAVDATLATADFAIAAGTGPAGRLENFDMVDGPVGVGECLWLVQHLCMPHNAGANVRPVLQRKSLDVHSQSGCRTHTRSLQRPTGSVGARSGGIPCGVPYGSTQPRFVR